MLYQLLWMFFIYAFLGWCCEVVFAAVVHGKLINRGFLNGPVCPIYGFGLILIVVCLSPLSKSLPLLFLGSMILTTVLEFFTGWILEKLFHTRWWDYSKMQFNLKGYICLAFSLIWGLAATAVMRIVSPLVEGFIEIIPRPIGVSLISLFLVLILADLIATIATVHKLQNRLHMLSELAGKIHGVSDILAEHLSGATLDAKDNIILYAPLKNMADAHRAEEKALFEAHKAQEMELLSSLRAEHREQLEDRRDSARQHRNEAALAFEQQLRARLPGARRLLKAFPEMKIDGSQALLDQMRASLESRRKKH